MKPMLAAPAELSDLVYPLYASPKIDGVRAIVMESRVFARSLKELPNKNVQATFGRKELEGLDGELIVGNPFDKDVYRNTITIVNSNDKPADSVAFWVFDFVDAPGDTFEDRSKAVSLITSQAFKTGMRVYRVPHYRMDNERQLREYEEFKLAEGYEGLILRSPSGKYKFGRSTTREGGMLKLKRFVDSEAEILEVYEEFENTNEAKTNALGRTERSSAAEGLKGKARAGGVEVKAAGFTETFRIGTGFNDDDKAFFWKHRKKLVGKLVKFKYFDHGIKDRPRHPVYLGPREEWDL